MRIYHLVAFFIVLSLAFLYWQWETIDRAVHQSTLIEINEDGTVKIQEPLSLPTASQVKVSLPEKLKVTDPVQENVQKYNEKNKRLVQDLEGILQE